MVDPNVLIFHLGTAITMYMLLLWVQQQLTDASLLGMNERQEKNDRTISPYGSILFFPRKSFTDSKGG